MSLTEKLHAGGFILSMAEGNRSMDNAVLLSGQNLKAGTVVGKILIGVATPAAKSGGNTGTGTITMDVTTPVKAGAKVGVYTVRNIAAVATGGVFRVTDPDGFVLGDVTIGTGGGGTGAFDNDIKFVLTDSGAGADFILGDGFDVTIAAGSGKFKVLAPAANDGSQIAAGILYDAVDASAADKPCVVAARDTEVNSNELIWPDAITDNQKAAALTQLAATGVISR